MLLDTLEEMTAARTLYRSLGFRDIAPYYRNPSSGIVYMELGLGKP
jgi:putative acetyltransferase